MLKRKWCSAWWCVAAGRSPVAHQSSLSVSAWSHHAPSGVDNAASPRLVDNANGHFTLRERLITMQKQLEGTQKYINEQVDRVAHIDGQSCNEWVHTRASSDINASNKTEQSIECSLVSFSQQHFLRRHKFWLHRQFSSPTQKRRNDGWWFPLVPSSCRFVLNSKTSVEHIL